MIAMTISSIADPVAGDPAVSLDFQFLRSVQLSVCQLDVLINLAAVLSMTRVWLPSSCSAHHSSHCRHEDESLKKTESSGWTIEYRIDSDSHWRVV